MTRNTENRRMDGGGEVGGCSSRVLIQEGGRQKNRVGGRVTDRVSTPFTWFEGWAYGNRSELFAGDFVFEAWHGTWSLPDEVEGEMRCQSI